MSLLKYIHVPGWSHYILIFIIVVIKNMKIRKYVRMNRKIVECQAMFINLWLKGLNERLSNEWRPPRPRKESRWSEEFYWTTKLCCKIEQLKNLRIKELLKRGILIWSPWFFMVKSSSFFFQQLETIWKIPSMLFIDALLLYEKWSVTHHSLLQNVFPISARMGLELNGAKNQIPYLLI